MPQVLNVQEADIHNVTTTTYSPLSPSCELTLLASASGRIYLEAFTQMGIADGNGMYTSFEVRENNVSGIVVLAATDNRSAVTRGDASGLLPGQHTHVTARIPYLLTGLTPGTTYYIRGMYRVSVVSANDIHYRALYAETRRDNAPVPVVYGTAGTFLPTLINVLQSVGNAVTFTGSTNGSALITVHGRIDQNSGAHAGLFMRPVVRQDSSTGSILSFVGGVRILVVTGTYMSNEGSVTNLITGLTPGRTYHAEVMAQTAEIAVPPPRVNLTRIIVESL
jgi:hypothetical protein